MPRGAALAIALALAAAHAAAPAAEQPTRRTIPQVNYSTNNYRLVVFSAGHFAVQVGGSWMPGCICLVVNGMPQYKTEHLSDMAARLEPLEDGRKLVISGRLTPDIRFVQTIVARQEHVRLTYVVEALRDLPRADIGVSAGPDLKKLGGTDLELETADGTQAHAYTDKTHVAAKHVRSILWKDVGSRNARTVFERCVASSVRIAEGQGRYRVQVFGPAPMSKGQRAEARIRFEAVPIGDARQWVRTMWGRLGHTRFGVSGVAGLVHNIRTDRGLVIQQLSLNEDGVHQVSVGRSVGKEWGGVRVASEAPGQAYAVEAKGSIVNAWEERIGARRVSGHTDELVLKARRTVAKPTKRLRLLMYVARWLEDERVGFYLETPDGKTTATDGDEPLWLGMPPREDEKGLGPYRVLGTFPAGTEVVVPMLSRGEVVRVRLGQPMEVCGFRFGIYFRGLWFNAVDKARRDIEMTVQVERLPQQRVGHLCVWSHGSTGAAGVAAGGTPLLTDIQPFHRVNGKAWNRHGRWTWRTKGDGARGTLAVEPSGRQGGVVMRIPSHLWGKAVRLTGPSTASLRLGADMPPMALPAGATLEVRPSALERLTLRAERAAELKLSRSQVGVASLALTSEDASVRLGIEYERITRPTPDPLASRPDPRPLATPDPGVYGGLTVKRDAPRPGDVTLESPWWRVLHERRSGGAIASIQFFHGTNHNILRAPIATRLWAGEEFSDVREAAAGVDVLEASPALVRLRVAGHLRSRAGRRLCPFVHLYEYRPMLVRRTCEYRLGEGGVECTRLAVGSMVLGPWLDEAATRRRSHRTAWHRAVFPGPPVFEETGFSQYMCLLQRGVEGIDWLPAGRIGQWERPGTARYAIEGDEAGNPVMAIEPLAATASPVRLTGTLRFESYMSLPQTRRCVPRRNFVISFRTGDCTEELLKLAAEHGTTDVLLGAGNTPGTFRLSDHDAARDVVARAHRHGLKVYPFDPFQLVHRSAEIWKHNEAWGRFEPKKGKPALKVYSSYGDWFCPAATGFRDALKQGYKRLVESVGFDGMYHDFVHPVLCHNTRHHPAPHLNTDGVLDVILWEREFLGPKRVFCGHTGWVPVLFFQDLCTVTAVFEEYPSHEPRPLHLTPAQGEGVGAAPRTLVSAFISHGTVAPGEAEKTPPPADQVRAYLARCALVGIFPWIGTREAPATDAFDLLAKVRPWLELFAIRGDEDLGTMQFLPHHRQTAAVPSSPFIRAATYWNRRKAIVVLANSESAEAVGFRVTLRPEHFGWPEDCKLTLTPTKGSAPFRRRGRNTFAGTLGGFEFGAYHVVRLAPGR